MCRITEWLRSRCGGEGGNTCKLFSFTDGSARQISRKRTVACWGLRLIEKYGKGNRLLIVSACGLVQTNIDGEFWVGATRSTNNTAEMQALIEALCWLNRGIGDKSITDDKGVIGGCSGFAVCQGPDRPEVRRKKDQRDCDASLSLVESGFKQGEHQHTIGTWTLVM